MRIIAGEWRGRRLVAPEGIATRPTGDRVREALFSMLASRIGSLEGLRVADLYAGSGALGLEALSRGAEFACFVEQDPRALTAIRCNIASLGATGRCRIVPGAVASLAPDQGFDLLLADPPYAPGSGCAALARIIEAGWAAPGAWIAIETKRGEAIAGGGCTLDAERDIGQARVTLFRR